MITLDRKINSKKGGKPKMKYKTLLNFITLILIYNVSITITTRKTLRHTNITYSSEIKLYLLEFHTKNILTQNCNSYSETAIVLKPNISTTFPMLFIILLQINQFIINEEQQNKFISFGRIKL